MANNSLSSSLVANQAGAQVFFAPTLLFGGAAVGMTLGAAVGRWWQVGSRVFFDLFISITAKGSSTGAVTIGNLPVTPAIGTANVAVGYSITNAITGSVSGWITGAVPAVVLFKTGSIALLDTDCTAVSQFSVSGNYTV